MEEASLDVHEIGEPVDGSDDEDEVEKGKQRMLCHNMEIEVGNIEGLIRSTP